jgi:hypothetical protein
MFINKECIFLTMSRFNQNIIIQNNILQFGEF